MKSVKFLSIIAAAAIMAACTGNKELQFSKSQMTIPVGQTSDVSIMSESTAATWTTGNIFIAQASADPGVATTVKANHVGETTLTATLSESKKGNLVVKVEPSINLLSNAIDFSLLGKDLSEIQAQFGTPETIVSGAENHFARYIDNQTAQQYVYMLDENNKVDYIQIFVILQSANELQNYNNYISQWAVLAYGNQEAQVYQYLDGSTPETEAKLGYPVAKHIVQLQYTGQKTGNGGLIYALIYGMVEFTSEEAPARVRGI